MNIPELQRQVEYKFAPGPLLAVQALANTYSVEDDEERLGDRELARRWLVESGLAAPEVEVSPSDLDRLLELRTLVRGVLESHLEAGTDTDRDGLARLAAGHPAPLAVSATGDLALDLEPVGSVDGFAAQILGIMFASRIEGKLERLKICTSDECRWAFYDSSKNRSGTWCRMEECGNRVKNRRYRARHADG